MAESDPNDSRVADGESGGATVEPGELFGEANESDAPSHQEPPPAESESDGPGAAETVSEASRQQEEAADQLASDIHPGGSAGGSARESSSRHSSGHSRISAQEGSDGKQTISTETSFAERQESIHETQDRGSLSGESDRQYDRGDASEVVEPTIAEGQPAQESPGFGVSQIPAGPSSRGSSVPPTGADSEKEESARGDDHSSAQGEDDVPSDHDSHHSSPNLVPEPADAGGDAGGDAGEAVLDRGCSEEESGFEGSAVKSPEEEAAQASPSSLTGSHTDSNALDGSVRLSNDEIVAAKSTTEEASAPDQPGTTLPQPDQDGAESQGGVIAASLEGKESDSPEAEPHGQPQELVQDLPQEPPRPRKRTRGPKRRKHAASAGIDVEGVVLARDDASLGARGRVSRTAMAARQIGALPADSHSGVTQTDLQQLPATPEHEFRADSHEAAWSGISGEEVMARPQMSTQSAYELLTSDRKCSSLSPQSRRLRKSALEGRDEYVMLLYMEAHRSLTADPEFDASRAPKLDLHPTTSARTQAGGSRSQDLIPLSTRIFERLSSAADCVAESSDSLSNRNEGESPNENGSAMMNTNGGKESDRHTEAVHGGRTRARGFYTPIVPMHLGNDIFAQRRLAAVDDIPNTGGSAALPQDRSASRTAEAGGAASPGGSDAYFYYSGSRCAHVRTAIYSELCDPEKQSGRVSPQHASAQEPQRAISPLRACKHARSLQFGIGTPTDPEHFAPGRWAPLKPLTSVTSKKAKKRDN